MVKVMKKVLVPFLLVACMVVNMLPIFSVSALAAVYGDFEYEITDGEATITDYTGDGGAITIPDTLGGAPVTSIGDEAFEDCTGLTEVTIPDSVTTIEDEAFEDCDNLETVSMSDNIKEMGWGVFYGTKWYDNLPDGMVYIGTGNYIFFCYKGTMPDDSHITIASGTKIIAGDAFCDYDKLTEVIIPDSVTTIGNYAFEDCTGLTSVTIPDSVTIIGDGAFYGCVGLTSITIPDSVTTIGNFAFKDCTGLTSVTIPDSVTTIGDEAFYGCTNLETVLMSDNIKEMGYDVFYSTIWYNSLPDGMVYIGTGNYIFFCYKGTMLDDSHITIASGTKIIAGEAFCNYDKLTSVTIPDSVTTIGDSAFYGCIGLTSVTIPDSVTTIGNGAFYGCIGLTSVTIPDSVTTIGNHAFGNCTGLTSITIPDSVTTIGDSAFYGCTSLTSVTIPDSVTTIGYAAFVGCTGLTSVTIPDSVTTIGDGAFYGCIGLTSVTIPDSVTTIGNHAFGNCTGLTSITIPDSMTYIGPYTFYGCTSLTSVTIPDSVTTIGYAAFEGCTGLTSVTIPDSVTTIGDGSFNGCTGLTSVTIPDSVTTIGDRAFYGCTGLTSVTIPDSVMSIGYEAFYGCDSLTILCYDGSYAHQYAIDNAIPFDAALVKVTGIVINQSSATVKTDGSLTLTATIAPENAYNKGVKWTSSDNTVATVDENGKVTPVAAGVCVITVTAVDGFGAYTSCALTVKNTDADYSAVDAAIAKIPADLSIYTDESVAALNNAKNAVIRGKDITEQAIVNGYAKAIEDSINALVKKNTPVVDNTPKPVTPATGDNTSVIPYMLLALLSFGMLAVLIKRRRA